jgi:quercetin dioxygenase-like cupin family protein
VREPSQDGGSESRQLAARRQLGGAIRNRRAELGMTLAEVGELASVSVSLLSQVERGLIDPSLDSLRNVAEALGTTPFHLMSDRAHRSAVTHRGHGRRVVVGEQDGWFDILTPWSEAAFTVAEWTLEAGHSNVPKARNHEGEEAIYVLSGTACVELGDHVYEIRPGDYIAYDAKLAHRVSAGADEPMRMLIITCPPY